MGLGGEDARREMRSGNLVAFRTDNQQTECFWRLEHKVQHLLYLKILPRTVVYFMKLHMVKNNHTQGDFFFPHGIYNVFFLRTAYSILKTLNKYRGEIHPEENQFCERREGW